MLSILIPIYNFNVCSLVEVLHQQCITLSKEFEIILFDDASDILIKNQNRKLKKLSQVQYIELKKNIGRSKIRNKLASAAKYDVLLFLDCDSGISNTNFVKNYLDANRNNNVVYGGTIYNDRPTDSKKILHYIFGKSREEKLASVRNNSPYLSFTSNNFLITKSIFQNSSFDENIKGYGYEDVLFSLLLKKQNQKIYHIDNPVEHLGLEDHAVFLQKTKKAIENLSQLQSKKLIQSSRLIAFYQKMKKYRILVLILFYFKVREKSILTNLKSESPNLYNLDLYKLMLYSNIQKSK